MKQTSKRLTQGSGLPARAGRGTPLGEGTIQDGECIASSAPGAGDKVPLIRGAWGQLPGVRMPEAGTGTATAVCPKTAACHVWKDTAPACR